MRRLCTERGCKVPNKDPFTRGMEVREIEKKLGVYLEWKYIVFLEDYTKREPLHRANDH